MKPLYVFLIVALIVVAGGIYYMTTLNQKYYNSASNPAANSGNQNANANSNPVNNSQSSSNAAPTSAPQQHSISISNYAFSPSALTVKVGDTVVWTNADSISHTVTSDSGNELSSGTLSGSSGGGYYASPTSGGTYSHTFSAAGTFSYHCSIHSMMKGTIIVQ